MRREFCHRHVVRYDECNNVGVLTPAAFLRYMQDIAAMDAEDAQLGGNGFWVVKRTILNFSNPVLVHTPLLLKTFGLGFSRITAQRGYEARHVDEPEGEPVISARTLWVYLNERGTPARLPERTAPIWLPDGPRAPQPETPFPSVPEQSAEVFTTSVRFSAIDLASHLNNAAAVEMLDDASWDAYAREGHTPETVRLDPLYYDIEYGDSPRFGETLTIQSWLDPLPASGQPCSRQQYIQRNETVAVRAYSRWMCV